MQELQRALKNIIPDSLFRALQPSYHYLLAFLGALRFGFPSRRLIVVGVTGTKGKSSVIEILNAIFEEAGYATALASTIRFKVGKKSRPNLHKMTMLGRFFLQRFLLEAANAGCTHALIEMTSEGVAQSRHRFIFLNALIFTNLTPEHIESHGSYENYVAAKLKLRDLLAHSPKRKKIIAVNTDSRHAKDFLNIARVKKLSYALTNAEPYNTHNKGIDVTIDGVYMHSPLLGVVNIYNILAAAVLARAMGVAPHIIKRAVEQLSFIPGRTERIDLAQPFEVIVDYAHTPQSLELLYQAFPHKEKVCVLGNAGGGRDIWKRPKMGAIADEYCRDIILTNEDPYDEDPHAILEMMAKGIKQRNPQIIMDRRKAIWSAFSLAKKGDVVLITGKGTDPFIMGPGESKVPWSDRDVAYEELTRILKSTTTPN